MKRIMSVPITRIPSAIISGTLVLVVMLSAGGGLIFHNPWILLVALASMVFIAIIVLLVLRISGVTELKKHR